MNDEIMSLQMLPFADMTNEDCIPDAESDLSAASCAPATIACVCVRTGSPELLMLPEDAAPVG